MASHIPFIFSAKDAKLAQVVFPDSEMVRISLEKAPRILEGVGNRVGLWLDGAIDGFDRGSAVNTRWKTFISRFSGWQKIGDPAFQQNPKASVVEQFVREVLDECLKVAPTAQWLSVPQLPSASDTSRNKINRSLAEGTKTWRSEQRKFRGKLILPVILTHQKQANLKSDRNRRIALAAQCFDRAGADGYWVVDSSLADYEGAGPLTEKRFPGVINFHKELSEALKIRGPSIAGPYWGLNLVLWARGLVDHPAIGLGVGYRYHVPGLIPPTAAKPKRRIALPPLRRLAIANSELNAWLTSLPKTDPALKELRDLATRFSKYALEDEARSQVTGFYKAWLDRLESTPAPGRALALYQDLSTAYVLGKPLRDLPDDEGVARRPERVAQQLMLQCL